MSACWAGNEHIDPLLVAPVAWPGLEAVVLARDGPGEVDQELVDHVGETAGT